MAMLAASASKVDVELKVFKDFSFKTPEFLKLNPSGKVPLLVTPEGPIYESKAIMDYFAFFKPETNLIGSTAYEKALICQWRNNVKCLFGGIIGQYMPLIGKQPYNKKQFEGARSAFAGRIKLFENALGGKKYLVGEKLTLADIQLIPILKVVMSYLYGPNERKEFKNVLEYFEFQTTQEYFTQWWPKVLFAEKTFPILSEEQFKKLQAEQQKAQKEAKKTKKKSKKKGRDVPKSKFVLYDFKTFAVNEKSIDAVVEKLKTDIDPKAFSIWRGRYDKLASEGKEFIRTANLVTNFLKGVNEFNKYVFGTYSIYGDEPDLEVRGVYFWNHPDFLPEMKQHPSSEYIQWTKLDINKEEDCKLIKEYWGNRVNDESKVEGLTLRRFHWVK